MHVPQSPGAQSLQALQRPCLAHQVCSSTASGTPQPTCAPTGRRTCCLVKPLHSVLLYFSLLCFLRVETGPSPYLTVSVCTCARIHTHTHTHAHGCLIGERFSQVRDGDLGTYLRTKGAGLSLEGATLGPSVSQRKSEPSKAPGSPSLALESHAVDPGAQEMPVRLGQQWCWLLLFHMKL